MNISRRIVRALALAAGLPALMHAHAEDQWWQFRGPQGNGHSSSAGLPVKWDEQSVVWKTPIHDRGWSSPVIRGDQVWVTTATKGGHKLFAVCVDKNSGKIIHDLRIFDVESPMAITIDNTHATPTPVIEEGRIHVHYGTYGTGWSSPPSIATGPNSGRCGRTAPAT